MSDKADDRAVKHRVVDHFEGKHEDAVKDFMAKNGPRRSSPPGAWPMKADAPVRTDMKTIAGIVMFTLTVAFGAAAIYFKMPSADQIAAIDAKHETARKALQTQVDSNTRTIGVISGQVGTLVQLKVAEAGRDPVKRRAIRIAAQRAQQALPTSQAPDPLAGTDLEQ